MPGILVWCDDRWYTSLYEIQCKRPSKWGELHVKVYFAVSQLFVWNHSTLQREKKKVTSTICLEVIASISFCQGTQKKKRREHCKAYLFTIFLLDYLLGLHRSWVLHSSAQCLHSQHRARKYEITFTISFFPLHTTAHEYGTRLFTYTAGEHFKLVNRWFRKWGQHTNGKWTDPPFSKWQTIRDQFVCWWGSSGICVSGPSNIHFNFKENSHKKSIKEKNLPQV